jgi:hypothetical protein
MAIDDRARDSTAATDGRDSLIVDACNNLYAAPAQSRGHDRLRSSANYNDRAEMRAEVPSKHDRGMCVNDTG